MASSTYDGKEFIVSSWGNWNSTMTATYELLSQSVANNTSTIRLRHYFYYGGSTQTTGSGQSNYVLDGQTTTWNGFTCYPGYTFIQSKDITVTHNADGSFPGRNVSISASGYTAVAGCSGSGTITGIASIPRKATLTEAPNFNDEANPKIKYSNKAGNSVSSLQVCIANSTGSVIYAPYRDASKTGSEYTFNLTAAERTTLRAAATTNSLSVRFYIKTVIGSSTYYDYADRTMSIINANPTFDNFVFEDVNPVTIALTGNNQYNVNGYSNIQVTIPVEYKAESLKEATMSKYRFVVGENSVDIPYSASEDVSGVLNNVSNGTYTVFAIDSRNNSKSVQKVAASVVSYEPLYINKTSSSLERNDNKVGDEAILNLQGTIWNNSFGVTTNSIKNVSYQLKKTGSDTWIDGTTTIQLTVTENTFSFTGSIASDNLDTSWDLDESYNVKVIIEDELSTAEVEFILPSAIPTMSMAKNGVGIMCSYDDYIGGALQVNGKRVLDIDSIYPVGSIYLTVENTDPNVQFGGTWVKMSGGYLYGCVNSIGNSSYTGSSTQSHTLTAAQSGLPSHAHQHKGYKVLTQNSGGNEKWAVSWGSDDDAGGSWTRNTGGTNASQGHSHNIAYIGVWVWKRTA